MSTFTETSNTTPEEYPHASGKVTGAAIPGSVSTLIGAVETRLSVASHSEVSSNFVGGEDPHGVNPELRLPPLKSLFIVIAGNALLQVRA